MFESVKELNRYRGMVRNFIKKEIRGRYKGSVLGMLWNFIVPFAQIIVYIVVFTVVFNPDIEAYPIYLIAGMVPWLFFSETLTGGTGSIVDNSALVTKIYFPRSVLPLATTVSKFVNFLISEAIVMIVIAIYGHGFDPLALLFLPIMMVLIMIFTLGVVLALSAINSYMRDMEYIVGVATMMMFWVTPIMYSRSTFDNALLSTVLKLNPMTYFVEGFDQILYELSVPNLFTLGMCAMLAAVSIVVGWCIFQHLERDFAEVM